MSTEAQKNPYTKIRVIGEGATGIVYEAVHADGRRCAVKELKRGAVSGRLEDLFRFKNEALAAGRLDHPGVIKIFEICETGGGIGLVMELVDGESLRTTLARNGALPLETALAIADEIAAALGQVHAAGIVHRDLKPGNILLEKNTAGHTRAVIIDFGLAAIKEFPSSSIGPYAGKSPGGPSPEPAGTFYYMAPEQTGIFRQGPDERSDLYSLGIILYEMITGRPPFTGDAIHSVVHQHLARIPEPPSNLNHALPPVLDQIIARLLDKDIGKRYQSARALRSDIGRLRQGRVDFTPGRDDPGAGWRFAASTIGRGAELDRLQAGMDQARDGHGSITLISGDAGIGKTRLLDELRRYAYTQGIPYIAGSCFPGEGKTPYGPVADAVNAYLRLFNRYPEARKREIREYIKKAVGDLGAILLQLNPSLAELLPPSRPLVPLPADREKKRFLLTLADFLFCIADAGAGLVIALDDLHWSDEGTLSLLFEILPHAADHALYIAGTVRDEESASSGIGRLKRSGSEHRHSLAVLPIRPFDRSAMTEYLCELLNKNGGPAIDWLAEFIETKSRGNPFFAAEILKHLIDKKNISIDEGGELLIDRAALTAAPIPETMLDVLMYRVSLLGDDETLILSHAAMIGRTFPLSLLIRIGNDIPAGYYSGEDIVAIIDRAIRLNLLEEDQNLRGMLSFTHDMVRESLYRNIDAGRKKQLHAGIAGVLESVNREAIERDLSTCPALFDLAHHWSNTDDRARALRYSLPAGIRSMENHAYEDALAYFSRALGFCGEHDRAIRSDIRGHIGALHLAIGNNDEAITILSALLPEIDDPVRKASLLQQISQACFKKGDMHACEQRAAEALGLLGERLPVSRFIVGISILYELCAHLLPVFFRGGAHRRKKTALAVWIYYDLCWLYVMGDSDKFARSALRMLNRSRRHLGPSRELGMSMAVYAVLCSTLHFFKRSEAFHRRALSMRERLDDVWGIAQSNQMAGYSAYFSGRPDIAIGRYAASIDGFRKIGDFKEVANSLAGKIWSIIITADYKRLKTEIDEFRAVTERIRDDYNRCYADFFTGTWFSYSGDYAKAREYQERVCDQSREREFWGIHVMANDDLGRYCMENGEIEKAINYFERAKALHEEHHLLSETAYIYADLAEAYIVQCEKNPPANASLRKARLELIQKMCAIGLRKARSSPLLLGGAYRALARYQALLGRLKHAERFFIMSIEQLARVHFRRDHGRSLFDYGVFLMATGNTIRGRRAIDQAYVLFSAIGSSAHIRMVRDYLGIEHITPPLPLERFYKKFRDEQRVAAIIELIREMNSVRTQTDIFNRALSILMELTGAEHAAILVPDENRELRVMASQSVNPGQQSPSATVVRRAYEGASPVITTNAEEDATLSAAESITFGDLKSIISVPIIFGGRTLGVCYLDNSLASGIFSKEDIEIIQLIMSQISMTFAANPDAPRDANQNSFMPSDAFYERYEITRREREVVELVLGGFTRKGISQKLGLAYKTVDNYIRNIYEKTGVSSKSELIELIRAFQD